MNAIQEATQALKKKISFGEDEPARKTPDAVEKESVPADDDKQLNTQNIKKLNSQNDKALSRQNAKRLERRKLKKNMITVYLLDEEMEMLDQLHFMRRRAKIDRSTILAEGLQLLHKKEIKLGISEQLTFPAEG